MITSVSLHHIFSPICFLLFYILSFFQWGLLITFIELIKNQRYQFWSHPFTRCATEIEKVFESVARSCMTPGSQHTGNVGGGEISQ